MIMRKKIRSGFNLILAVIFIVLGFIGLALPVVPQTIFFIVGFIIFSFEFPQLANWIESKMDKEGKIWKIYHTHRQKFEKYFK